MSVDRLRCKAGEWTLVQFRKNTLLGKRTVTLSEASGDPEALTTENMLPEWV